MSQAEKTHSTTPPEIPGPAAVPRPLVERVIEALIVLLDTLDPDPDLELNGDEEPSLGWTLDGRIWDGAGDDREGDTADDEPSLGATLDRNQLTAWGSDSGARDDREGPVDDEEPTLGWSNPALRVEGGLDQSRLGCPSQDGDLEPELGWSEMETRYGCYAYDSIWGLEADHDGSEPSLGWQNEGSQGRLRTTRGDREEQCEDEGAQCEDEGGEHDGCEPDYDNEVDSWPNPMGPEVGARP